MNNTLPTDERTEALILGCIINSFEAANAAFAELNDSDFANPKHKVIFQEAKEIYLEDRPIDLTSMLYNFNSKFLMEKSGGAEYLIGLANNTWSGAPFTDFIEKLKNTSSLRKLIYSAKDALFKAQRTDAQSDEIISELQASLFKTQGVDNKIKSSKEIINTFSSQGTFEKNLDWMRDRFSKGLPTYEGISCGYRILDQTLGFFRNSCIYYIGARTSMGKTTFMLNLIRGMSNKKIGIFSLEMPAQIIMAKLVCMVGDIRYSDYEDGNLTQEKAERLIESAKRLEMAQVYIEDPSSITLQTLRLKAKRMASNYEIEVLFIDYLTRIRSNIKHNSKHLEVDEISKGLQSLAKELSIPIICLAQLNRQAVKDGKKPSLSEFRESGSIEEDADACLLIHRPEYYEANNKPGIVEIIVAKNRLRGIIRTIEFNCKKDKSEIYYELETIQEQVKRSQDEESERRFEQKYQQGFYKDE